MEILAVTVCILVIITLLGLYFERMLKINEKVEEDFRSRISKLEQHATDVSTIKQDVATLKTMRSMGGK